VFCPQCGTQLEDGKSFCKFCGARIAAEPEPTTHSMPDPKGRPRWVVPFLAAVGIVIVGFFVGLAVLLIHGSSDSPKATTPLSTGTMTDTTSSPPATANTVPGSDAAAGALTTATVPSFDPDSTSTSTVGGAVDDEAEYALRLDDLVALLTRADSRIPELATEINNTAPRVPSWVDGELASMRQDVENALGELAGWDPPQSFQRADELIFNAADEMLYRIDQTRQGIDAMRGAGTVDAGRSYFDAGRQARDQYHRLFDQYRSARP